MAFTSISKDMNIISVLSDLPNEDDGLSPSELKAKFDEAGLAVKQYINDTLISELEGETASENLGAKAITGVEGANIYAQLNNLKTQLDDLTMGEIPDNSLQTVKLQDDCVTNAKLGSDVTALITALTNVKVPTGTILPFAGSTAPSNAIICDGSAVLRSTYSALFTVIGTTYGVGDGSTTFNVPNLKGKIPIGYNSSESEFNSLGKTGGEKTHTLTNSEMPSHNHPQTAHNHNLVYSGGGNIGLNNGSNGYGLLSWDTTGDGSLITNNATPSIGSVGSSLSHNNIQPYITVNYIIIAL